MVPVVTRAPNIKKISCWKIAPKPLVYIDPRIILKYYTFIPGKTIKIESGDVFQILVYFQNCDVNFINRYLTVWGFTIVFPQFPLFPKLLDFFIHLLIPAYGQFVTMKTSKDEFSFKKTLFHPKTTYSHTKIRFFLGRYRSPNGPHLFRMVQPIRSPENPGTTVVSIGHLTPWPENPGYRTQVWDKR